jgi:MoaA/NifB/PqqE/SkfB family radical SAM enzyme
VTAAWRWGEVAIDTVQVEVTRDCNLKCPGCLRTLRNQMGRWQSNHMNADLFGRVLAHLPACRVLILNGTGEPMLNPDIAAIVGQARQSGKYQGITFNSNGLARPIEDYVAVAKAGLSFLSVSVDSLTQEVADRVRTGTKVEKLAARIRELAVALPIPLTITSVVCRENLLDVGETLAKLNGLGKFSVFLTDWSDVAQLDFLEPMGRRLQPKDFAFLSAMVEKSRPQFPNLDIVLTQTGARDRNDRCQAPFRHPFIDADGFVTPCCTLTDAHHYGHLPIAEMPLVQALKQPQPARWLEGYAAAEPLACRGCQHAVRR